MTQAAVSGLKSVPRTVWALGLVSLFMDTSSELVHSLMPVFLVSTLGASTAMVGLIEGVGEATAAITKVFSGWISDRLGKRKLLAVIGYGLAALTKPIFPLAVTPYEVLAARFVDRVGKGVRGAPRDAMVADVTPKAVLGAAFGLRQALDTVGAFAGPLLAMGLMVLLANDIRKVFWWAVIPGIICVLLLIFGVEEPEQPARAALQAKSPIGWGEIGRLGAPFWTVTAIGAALSLAGFSQAFLILRARSAGLDLSWTPMVLIVMNVVYAAVSTPAGSLSDRIDRRWVLAAGLGVLIAADLVLAFTDTLAATFVGIVLWGLYMGLTQGLLSALVAEAAPSDARGTAFGVFNLVSGLALLAASGVAGVLWARFGPQATFEAGAGFAALALVGLAMAQTSRRPPGGSAGAGTTKQTGY
jgi:MFS family permease